MTTIRVEPRAAAALAPLIMAGSAIEMTAANAADAHVAMLQTFAASLGHHFVLGRKRPSKTEALDIDVFEPRPHLFVDGWIVDDRLPKWLPHRRHPPDRDPDIRIQVLPDPLVDDQERRPFVELNYIYLPSRSQRIGAAPTLLAALETIWLRMGAQGIRAHGGTEAGAAAFVAWGYRREAEDFFGLPSFFKPIGGVDREGT